MESDQKIPVPNGRDQIVPPPLAESPPPAVPFPPPASVPPLAPPPKLAGKAGPFRQFVVIFLNLCLGLFLADAVISFADASLILFLGIHVLDPVRGVVGLFTVLLAIVVYGLIGLSPMIPKRMFLPIALFNPLALLLAVPALIYFYGRIQFVDWVLSLCQLLLGLVVLCWIQGGFKLRWPLFPETQLADRRFTWPHLARFLLVNVFVLLPFILVYLVLCVGLAVNHFSEGFVALQPDGFSVQVRKYVRNDGKTIQLVPMAHVAEADFYRNLAQSFPTNCTILMEGVTDDRNLLTNRISYKRMASTLHLSSQEKEFRPKQGKLVWGDVDVSQFTTSTIDFLNLVMFVHSRGLNVRTLLEMVQYSPPPHFEEQLWDDILHKRNRRVLEQIHTRLPRSDYIVVPWGVAHMPEIARELEKSGFRLEETQKYTVIRFRGGGPQHVAASKQRDEDDEPDP
jgi:hypothetical protein